MPSSGFAGWWKGPAGALTVAELALDAEGGEASSATAPADPE